MALFPAAQSQQPRVFFLIKPICSPVNYEGAKYVRARACIFRENFTSGAFFWKTPMCRRQSARCAQTSVSCAPSVRRSVDRDSRLYSAHTLLHRVARNARNRIDRESGRGRRRTWKIEEHKGKCLERLLCRSIRLTLVQTNNILKDYCTNYCKPNNNNFLSFYNILFVKLSIKLV